MAFYLWQVSYSSDAWQAQVKNPKNRLDVVIPIAESLGGKIIDAWFAFGEYDVVVILEMPDNVNMAALALAATSTGMLDAGKTTVLLPLEEGIDALKKAGKITYPAPKG